MVNIAEILEAHNAQMRRVGGRVLSEESVLEALGWAQRLGEGIRAYRRGGSLPLSAFTLFRSKLSELREITRVLGTSTASSMVRVADLREQYSNFVLTSAAFQGEFERLLREDATTAEDPTQDEAVCSGMLQILSSPFVERVIVAHDDLCVTTVPVVITRDDTAYDMGSYTIVLKCGVTEGNWGRGRCYVNIRGQDDRQRSDATSGGVWHPHISSHGEPCLGSQQIPLDAAAARVDIAAIVELLFRFLGAYHPPGAMAVICHWRHRARAPEAVCPHCTGVILASDESVESHNGIRLHRRCAFPFQGRWYEVGIPLQPCSHCGLMSPCVSLCTDFGLPVCPACRELLETHRRARLNGEYICPVCQSEYSGMEAVRAVRGYRLPNNWSGCQRCCEAGESQFATLRGTTYLYKVERQVYPELPALESVLCSCGAEQVACAVLSSPYGTSCPECDPEQLSLPKSMWEDRDFMVGYLFAVVPGMLTDVTRDYIEMRNLYDPEVRLVDLAGWVKRVREIELRRVPYSLLLPDVGSMTLLEKLGRLNAHTDVLFRLRSCVNIEQIQFHDQNYCVPGLGVCIANPNAVGRVTLVDAGPSDEHSYDGDDDSDDDDDDSDDGDDDDHDGDDDSDDDDDDSDD